MVTVTAAEVWKAALRDAKFAEQMSEDSEMRAALRPYIEAAPVVLAAILDQPLSLNVLVNAKIAFLRHCMQNGFIDLWKDQIGGDNTMLQSVFDHLLALLESMAEDIPAFLQAHNMTERDVMLSESAGLSDDNKRRYRAGRLTVADVLRTQPSVILSNGD